MVVGFLSFFSVVGFSVGVFGLLWGLVLDFCSILFLHGGLLVLVVSLFFRGEGSLAESCGWVFVDHVPLIYDKRRVARQLQVETWLRLAEVVSELRLEDVGLERLRRAGSTCGYVV